MADFEYTPAQREALALLSGPAKNVMLFGGSRSGKTFVLCCALAVRALKAPGGRHAVIRRHFNGVRTAVGMDTFPKVMKLRFPQVKFVHNRTENVFTFPNGSEIWLAGLDDAQRADKILGKEFSTIYFNECSELDYASVTTALTRLAQNVPGLRNKAFFDCNPPSKNHWTYHLFIEKTDPADRTLLACPENYAAMRINPADNAINLPCGYIENTLAALPARQRARFLEGRFADECAGALWKQDELDSHRVVTPPELERIVIGVDPAVTGGEDSDLTGIVAAGRGTDGRIYVLADRSCRASPLDWAKQVISLYRELEADRVVGEVNNGGDLIENLLREFDPDVSFRAVRAARGKIIRAEPVAALYEKGMVSHT
ncbi:MAG: DNA-packaging protein, partial [Lentisphaeria bacterium]|nr:DNA-packaging protein [Lentisphaeria bacterium]